MGYEILEGAYPQKGEVLVGQYFAYNFMDTIMPEGKNYVDRWVWDEETQSYSENTPDPFFNPLTTPVTLEMSSYEDQNADKYRQELKISGITKARDNI